MPLWDFPGVTFTVEVDRAGARVAFHQLASCAGWSSRTPAGTRDKRQPYKLSARGPRPISSSASQGQGRSKTTIVQIPNPITSASTSVRDQRPAIIAL